MSALLCPSMPNTRPDGAIFDQMFGEHTGTQYILHALAWPPEAGLGVTHYQAVAGIYGKIGPQWYATGPNNERYNADKDLIGVYSTRSKISTAHIVDGMSKMLAFGEAPGAVGQGIQSNDGSTAYGEFALGVAWIGTATLPTLPGLNSSHEDGTPNAGAHYDVHWAHFGSLHRGGIVQFVYCDGSVHSIPKDVDVNVLDALSTIRGGETVDMSEF